MTSFFMTKRRVNCGLRRDKGLVERVTASFPVSPGPGDEGDWEFAIIGFLLPPP
jgi:hypothetical protein